MCTTVPNQPFTECSPTALGFVYNLDNCGHLELKWCSPILPSEFDKIEYVVTQIVSNTVSLIPADSNGNALITMNPGEFDIKLKVYKRFCESHGGYIGCCGSYNGSTNCTTCILTIDHAEE